MKNIKFLLYIFLISITSSCIPNKDLVYLQNKKGTEHSIEIDQAFSKPYKVQVNDILNISIKALDQKLVDMFSPSSTEGQQAQAMISQNGLYFNGFTVDDHGNIRVPVLGEINVLGFTVDEIRETVEKRLLDEYFKSEARIFVKVKLAGLRYTINGEINNPGTNVLYQQSATIMEAIANSGDITLTGNRKKVQIIRKQPYGYDTHYLDLTDSESMKSPFFYIQSNDYIYIKPLPQKSWGTGTTGMQTVGTIITALSLITTTILLTRNL